MILQRFFAKSPRLEAWIELVEMTTGLLLLVFLQLHVLTVSRIIMGPAAFNRDSARLDEYYLSYVVIPLVLAAIVVHGLAALRKAPWRFQEMRVFLQHGRRLAHLDTWAWLVQIITGMMVLVLAAIHVWTVLLNWPISAASSAARIQGGYFSFSSLLLLVAEIHAMTGLYRLLVKWSGMRRQRVAPYLIYATMLFVGLGFIGLLAFYFHKLPAGLP